MYELKFGYTRVRRDGTDKMDMTCKNIINDYCNGNVHNIIEKMGQKRFKEGFRGGLFIDEKYPVFEGDECIQYLQEYVPFHLPQIEYVLRNIICEYRYFANHTINIMDVGSGPATVPLAFCRLFPTYMHKYIFKITTIEASEGFNNMINIFKATNTNESVEIVKNLKYNYFDENFMTDESIFEVGYDWIIIANFISAIGQDKTQSKVNRILNEFISNVLCYTDKVLLTFVDGKSPKYFKIPVYYSKIERIGFDDLKIIRTISNIYDKQFDIPWMRNCKVYKTKYSDHYSPYIYSKSLLLESK